MTENEERELKEKELAELLSMIQEEQRVSVGQQLMILLVGFPIHMLITGAITMLGWNTLVTNVFLVQQISYGQSFLVGATILLVSCIVANDELGKTLFQSGLILGYSMVFMIAYSLLMSL